MHEITKYFLFTENQKQFRFEGSLLAIRCLDGALGMYHVFEYGCTTSTAVDLHVLVASTGTTVLDLGMGFSEN